MKNMKKILALLFCVVMVICTIECPKVKAASSGSSNPQISVKLVNKKTGVKITIGKTKGAQAYEIKLSGFGDAYEGYREEYSPRTIATIKKDGTAKRTYTIKGLPKGTYYISVSAMVEKRYYEEGEWDTMLEEIGRSEDVKVNIKASKVKAEAKTYDFSSAKVGDIITFGSYEQDGLMTNGKEDIEWIVLSKTDKEMLVISKYVLDLLPYNTKATEITWADCSLRGWLNNSFYKTAFTKSERKMIKTTKLKNTGNSEHGTAGGKSTKDKVFLPTAEDMLNTKYGFSDSGYSDDNRIVYITEFAKIQNQNKAYYNDALISDEGRYPEYCWLRTPGMDTMSASVLDINGSLNMYGYYSDFLFGVRPAIVISLNS